MSQSVTFNNVSYTIPSTGDVSWGTNVSNYLVAIAAGTLQPVGGSFPLTADVNFGSNFGLASLYYKSTSSNVASAGQVRLASTDTLKWRNNANSGDVALSKDTSDNLLWNGTKTVLSGAIVNADIAPGAAIAYSKLALTGSILNADLAGSIAVNKLVALSTSKAVATDGSGFLVAATTTAAELNFVSGVTSAIQTQINTKQATLTAGQLPGTATNDSASAGNVGEFIDSSISSLTTTGASGVYANVTSISLTAGDWDVSGNVIFSLGTATGITNGSLALSAFSGNTTTDHVAGKNAYGAASYPTATQDASVGVIPRWRVSIASTTTIFLKGQLSYSGGTPKFYGYISARRVR